MTEDEHTYQRDLSKELEGLEKDKAISEYELGLQRNKIALQLQGGMGTDIDNVLSGKEKIALSTKEKINYKIKNFFSRFFSTF
jgi:hypothetical protein